MTLNVVDAAILLIVILGLLIGLASGFVRGVVNILCGLLTLLVMILGYAPLSTWLRATFGLTPRPAILLAFALLALASQFLCSFGVYRLAAPLMRLVSRSRPLRRLDHLLGVLPGALTGIAIAGAILAPLAFALPEPYLGAAIHDARLAPPLLRADAKVLVALDLQPRLLPAVEALGTGVVAPPSEERRQLPFRVAARDLAPDPQAEARLFALVNEARAQAGLKPLAFDSALVTIARAHALEMFEQGYFAHDSTVTGSPFDRMKAAGISFTVAGENLAYAPSVDIAHRGLMNSLGHRANILSPDFGRVGIGVIRSRDFGLMIVQDFRN